MLFTAIVVVPVLFQMYNIHTSMATEPICSKFSFEEQLLEKMIRTEVKVEMIQSEIKKTEDIVLNTLNEIKKTVADITENVGDFRNNITEEMEAKIMDIQKKEDLFQKTLEELKINFKKDMENERNISSEFREMLTLPSVAFHAHHVTDTILDVTDEIIKFDSIITNEGSGYDNSTGIFTAPVGGLYQFTVHICSYKGKHSPIALVLAGKEIAKSVIYDKNESSCSSSGTIVRMESGEKIWIKCTAGSSSYRLYQDTHRMNTFSGILLSK
ncbi:complement C1q and tumor necrosis factor-related protein 9A-like [Mercenaria mercenaria]|uniref:complement C1q and tumor necrosis factor-related protein 9A-like n=1 Tax=Mercenaria mercenaria TaxID=6596 RepID=UPI00234EA93A|nr:complement C1q and tumor necrosis factor-related protein 9A-like [Mercenaria mercenaria]